MNTSIASSGYQLEAPTAQRDIQVGANPLRWRARRRRWRMASLVLTVLLPTALSGAYLYGYADDQYVTEFRFSVRHEAPLRMDGVASQAPAASLGASGTPASSSAALATPAAPSRQARIRPLVKVFMGRSP